MLPFANTRAMQMHLDEISCNVAAKAHGVVLMDRAGKGGTGQASTYGSARQCPTRQI